MVQNDRILPLLREVMEFFASRGYLVSIPAEEHLYEAIERILSDEENYDGAEE